MNTSVIFYAIAGALGYVILQSLFILGIRIAAKGETEILPDGREKDSEMILFPIFKFLTQAKKEQVYYSGKEFTKLIHRIQLILTDMEIMCSDTGIKLPESNDSRRSLFLSELNRIISGIDAKIQMEVLDREVRFYKINEEYRFSKYFRKPIIQCPICMASFWSIFSFWIPVVYFYEFNFWVFYSGIINICAVAATNWMLFVRATANEVVIMRK